MPDLTPNVLPPGPELVAGLDTGLPLALFPVRLATRFHRPAPGEPPDELWVRIFPDVIHADGHQPGLTADELVVGRATWENLWRAAGDPPAVAAAQRWAVSQLGPGRSAWVLGRTAPANQADAPTKPVSSGRPVHPGPRFPDRTPRKGASPTVARLLPDRWCVIMRRSIEYVERVWTKPVRRDLAMAPNLGDLPEGAGIRELLQSQDLAWLVDFDEAVAAGMAVKLPWRRNVRPRHVTELLVFGVRGPDPGAPQELTDLLEAQRFTEGVELVPPGTPTNNTDTVRADYAEVPSDLAGFFDRQIGPPPATGPRPGLPPTLSVAPAGAALTTALGLADSAFQRAEHATSHWASWARDMNRTMWPATVRYLLTRMLPTAGSPPLGDDALLWLRRWFADWVRGPGLLPAFRIGAMPYGVLPALLRPAWDDPLGASHLDGLRSVLRDVSAWETSVGNVAHFSHLAGAPAPTPEEEAIRLGSVLGAVPHPTAIRLRRASDSRSAITAEWDDHIAELERLLALTPYSYHALYDGDLFEDRLDGLIKDGTIDEQSAALSRLRDVAQDMIPTVDEDTAAAIGAVRDHLDRKLRPMVAAHRLRSETRRWDDAFSSANLPTAADPPLWYVQYGDDGAAADGTVPALRLVPPAPARAAADLRDYAADARRTGSFPRPAYPDTAQAALLIKLVQQAVETVPPSEAEDLALGLEGLAAMLESGDGSTDELERLLRETLGLATHRYDAWVTSVANERLAALRVARPTGLQIGGFGWVVNLSPDRRPGPDSRGFIHAPSLDHAVTAGVLRSAWLAHRTDAADAPFGVDLSSDRVRRALWLLDGVRNGVELGELLGARFERRLHDRRLSHLIADVRERVLAATGRAGRPASAIVDGLALATAYRPSTTADPVRQTVEQWRATLPPEEGKALRRQLDGTVADLDATADVLTAQAVHSVTKGNLAEGAAVLSVAGAGDAGIPKLRMPSIHRPSSVVTHRVLALLPAASDSAGSVLAKAEPALAGWLARLLPAFGALPVAADVGEPGAITRWSMPLAETGLGPLEVVSWASPDGDLNSSRLGGLLAARARHDLGVGAEVPVTFVDPGDTRLSLTDVTVAAGALRSALGSARPVTGGDLTDSEAGAGTVDVTDLDARRRALVQALQDLASHPRDRSLLTERFADLAAVDLEGLVAALGRPDDAGAVAALVAEAQAIATQLAELPADESLADRMTEVLALPLPVLPTVVPADAAELRASFAATTRRVGSPVRALSWLSQVCKVHAGAGRIAEALDLIESVHPAALPVQVAQLPAVADDPWVAVARPSTDAARLHLCSVSDAASALEGAAVSGVVFEAWSEPIPGCSVTSGLAIHFDRPGAQPPQAVILAMPPTKGGWSVDHIEQTLLQTLQLAQARAVGPETLDGWGHTLPGVFLSGDVAVATEGPS